MSMINEESDKHLKESLSALMDNEANELEMRRVLDRLKDDESLKKTAFTYQLIGDVVRKEAHACVGVDLSSAISDEIAKESPAEVVKGGSERWRSIGIFSMAASVTLAVVVGVKFWSDESPKQQDIASAEGVTQSMADDGIWVANSDLDNYSGVPSYGVTENALLLDPSTREQTATDRMARERFDAYIRQHIEQQSLYIAHSAMSDNAVESLLTWAISWVPDGFSRKSYREIVSPASQKPVDSVFYSDGTAAFSVLVEEEVTRVMSQYSEKYGTMAAVSMVFRNGDAYYNVTVVGDIPLDTAERIAVSITPASMKHSAPTLGQ
ncbi:MAG: MucB/RseB C-terminal domain-containing protein [Endozoicomonadaceae bacterium]|nr:MucB/RseB C-terminal domain-containing protein [Endozoicomonadaceae bacterium]